MAVALLTGLMLGSLCKVWPWKVTLETIPDDHGELLPVVQQNVLPQVFIEGAVNLELLAAVGLAVLGFAVVVLLERWAKGPA